MSTLFPKLSNKLDSAEIYSQGLCKKYSCKLLPVFLIEESCLKDYLDCVVLVIFDFIVIVTLGLMDMKDM